MLRLFSFLFLFFGIENSGWGQTAPTYTDWVKPNQTYLQIKVGKNGVYRIPATALSAHFPNLATSNAAGFQLFRRGKEQAILVNAGTDNLLNGNEYIDFVGLINDATSEYEMYQKPMSAINEYRSLYDDTAHYFLTYSQDLNGKRVTNNGLNNNTSISFEPFAWRTAATFQTSQYAPGAGLRGNVTYSSYFTAGEGWTGPAYSVDFGNNLVGDQFNSIRIKGLGNVYSDGPKPILEVLEVGRKAVPHLIEVLVGTNNVFLDTFSFTGKSSRRFVKSLDASLIEGADLPLRLHALQASNVSISYALLKYPATFEMPNGMVNTELELPANSSGYCRLRFSNLGNLPELYDYTDPLNPVRVGVGAFSGQYVAGVENTNSSRKLIIQPQPFSVTSNGLTAFSFTNFLPQSFDYVIVSNPKLRKPTLGVADPIEAYAEFRRSIAGGSYKVLVLNMDEVYSRFGYGDHTPMSIRNLCGYFIQNQAKPKAMFLIGKGINLIYRYDGYYQGNNLVPTFGTPPSDNAYTVGLGEPERTIAFPVGRLSASKPEQVLVYLDKVKETEAFQYNDLWKKNMYHISGGLTGPEQAQFKSYISNLTSIAESKFMGARVGVYNKITLNNVQPVDIRKVLNNGISLLTLFGHSSQSTSDVDIGLVSDPSQGINNVGKYPVVIVNGCFAGDIYNYTESLNENWIFTPNKGAVVFWAATDEGLSALLGRHIQTFYKTAFADSLLFGKSMGEIQKEAMRIYLKQFSSEPQLDSSFMHQFTIHGDPVIKIFGANKPDYKTSNGEIFLNSTNPSASDQVLKIGVIASNFGRFTGDSLNIGVKRTLGTGEVITNLFLVKSLAYKDTFLLDLPNIGASNFAGINKIEVFLDFLNKEAEMNENNNVGLVEFFLPTAGILPLFPKEYSIVSSRNVRFVVQASSLFTQDRKYLFELDTSASFNSSVKRQSPPIVAGNIGTWNATLPLDLDSTVYFWRVRFQDQQSSIDTAWYRRSFEYIGNSPSGWSQSQFYQFKNSKDDGVQKDYVTRKWNFPSTSLNIDLKVSGGGKNSPKIWELKLNGSSILSGTSGTNCYKPGYASVCGLHFDQNTLLPQYWNYYGFPELYYDAGCGRVPLVVNAFHFPVGDGFNMTTQFIDDYIKRIVPVGDYVLLFSVDSTFFETIPDTVVAAIQYMGIYQDSIDKVKNGNPFIFFGRVTKDPSPGQGDVIFASPALGKVNDQMISFSKTLTANSTYGTITSTKIGPASQWGKLFNKMARIETPIFDKTSIQVIGSSLNGKDTVLIDQVTSFPFDLSSIPATDFPFLTLKAYVKDSAYRTPALLKRWMVTYQGVPEGVINTSIFPASEYKVGKLDEGDSLGFRFAFSNISDRNFQDSVKVRYSINNAEQKFKNLGKLPKDSTVRFTIDKFSTLGKAGMNSLQVFVNPRLQPEEYFENNVVEIPFKVTADKTNPVLDVTFDGVKIMNGDFVSPEPLVSVTLKDENKYLLKGDTAGLTLLMTRPCPGCQAERIALNSTQVKVFPAGKDNLFRLEYRPGKLVNGNYRFAVQGTDVKGNESGSSSYNIDFQVVNENTITNFYPYPNPFSTSCQWVFTMTGQTFPEDFKIQIMTVTGKVVREIFKSELGPLKIGNNVTQYRWNATDDFGDRLANGVYLYRVVMKEGSNFAQRTTAADGTFTKGFGKLYIIR